MGYIDSCTLGWKWLPSKSKKEVQLTGGQHVSLSVANITLQWNNLLQNFASFNCFVPTHEPAVSESFDIILLFTPRVIV